MEKINFTIVNEDDKEKKDDQKLKNHKNNKLKFLNKDAACILAASLLLVPISYTCGKQKAYQEVAQDFKETTSKNMSDINLYITDKVNNNLNIYDAQYMELFNNITFNYYLSCLIDNANLEKADELLRQFFVEFDDYTDYCSFLNIFEEEQKMEAIPDVSQGVVYQKKSNKM